jgi:hypothetical protein
MHHRLIVSAGELSNAELLCLVAALAGKERGATVDLVAHLGELDARKLHLAEGYGSLFAYCTRALHLAEHAAYNRIEAARVSRKFPVVLDLLANGSMNLSTVRLLAPHFRPDNFERLVAEARGRSKREVEELVARLAPRPDVEASVRKLPARVPSPSPPGVVATASPTAPTAEIKAAFATPVVPTTPERPAPRPLVAPLAPERYRVQFTVGAATYDKLRQVQDLLRREIPDGDPVLIFDRALTLLLEDVARKKLASASKPRSDSRTRAGSRHVPARAKRAVWLRDGGRCAFVAGNGRRCDERAFLEFHHDEPYAIGGEPAVANISLRCRAHNVYESDLVFGPRASVAGRGRENSPRGELRPSEGSGDLTRSPAPPRAADGSASPG